MPRAIISRPWRRAAYEPLYDVNPQTGTIVEVFYADRVLARSFGACDAGWFWWISRCDFPPNDLPIGPFVNSYLAYRMPQRSGSRNCTSDMLDCFQKQRSPRRYK